METQIDGLQVPHHLRLWGAETLPRSMAELEESITTRHYSAVESSSMPVRSQLLLQIKMKHPILQFSIPSINETHQAVWKGAVTTRRRRRPALRSRGSCRLLQWCITLTLAVLDVPLLVIIITNLWRPQQTTYLAPLWTFPIETATSAKVVAFITKSRALQIMEVALTLLSTTRQCFLKGPSSQSHLPQWNARS